MHKDTYQTVPIFQFSETIKKLHTKKRLQCLVMGNFGAYNLADEAILAGVLTELAKIPNLKVTVASKNPNEIKRLHDSVRTIPLSAARKEIKKSNFVLIGGGGLFSNKYLYVLALLLWKQRMFKKKIYILGLGLTDTTNFTVNLFTYQLIKGATLVTARDQHTADILKKKNIHVHVFKDQSFFMEPATISNVMQDPYFKRFYNKNRMNIGLALRKPASKKEEKHLLSEIVTFIAKNYTTSDFWFYASDHHPGKLNDEKFGHVLHETVKKKVGKDVQFHFIPTTWSPYTYFASLKLMNFLVSMCTYAAFFSYRNNSNIVNIIDKNRSASLLYSLGKDVLKVADVTAKKLQTRLST